MRRVPAEILHNAAREEAVSVEDDSPDSEPVDDVRCPAMEDVDDDAVGRVLGEELLEGFSEYGGVSERGGGHGGVGREGVVWEVEDVDCDVAVEGLVAVDGVPEAEGVGECGGEDGGLGAVGGQDSGGVNHRDLVAAADEGEEIHFNSSF